MADDKEAFQNFFKAALEGGWGLLQHYMCRPMPRDKHMNMTGGGLGNVFGARQRPGIPLDLYSSVQVGGFKKDDDGKEEKKEKVCINMVNPTQQAVDQAKSTLKRKHDMELSTNNHKLHNMTTPPIKRKKNLIE